MIKQLVSCIREYKKDSLLTPFFVTLEVVMEVVIPLLMASLIDKGIDTGNQTYIWQIGLVLVMCALISMAFGAMSSRYAARASAGFARNLRHDLYNKVQEFSFSSIDRFSSSGIVTRLTTDVTNIQNAYQMLIRVAVRCPVMLVFSLIMSFSINTTLSLVFLCAIPVLGLGLAYLIFHAYPLFQRVFTTYDRLNKVVQENLHGIRVVKSFVREDYETNKFTAVSEDIYDGYSKAEKTMAWNMPLMQLCIYACMLLISWIGARLIVGSSMTTGQLVSLISYAMQILTSLMMLSMVLVMITIARTSAERVDQIFKEKNDLCCPANPVTSVPDGSVTFQNVNFSYAADEQKLCLEKISFEIKSGETVGIIGGTGTSKSTLVQLIPRLYDTTSGTVLVGGIDVKNYDLEVLRDEVAMVLQKNELFSGTIKENLRWGNADADDSQLIHACKLACADSFISAFPDGYDTRLEQNATNVSGGQKQRLCIARALLKKPKILILDDSTSAVDTRTDALIRKAFREEIPHTTKFIIAQRISSIEDADKIIIMDRGTINGFGTHQTLLAGNAIYREVYESQMKGESSHE